jgi:predicted 2-oxoglutarate/Fe(II)-dependent dioxygenase YbiX
MVSVTSELAAVLKDVRRPGSFFSSGVAELAMPLLEVEGVGTVAFPVLPAQAASLVAVAERAPYGRGPDTLVDPAVRNTWQIGPDRISLKGRRWPHALSNIVARAAEGLGVTDPVDAEFYKLLIYEKGSFFVSHRDTEKAPGMFATLVIVLPSFSAGGDLVVRHQDKEVRLDARSDDPGEVAFAAFYADCLHEVLPVTEGHRLTLIYNLTRHDGGKAPEPPGYDREKLRIITLLRDWTEGRAADETGGEEPDGPGTDGNEEWDEEDEEWVEEDDGYADDDEDAVRRDPDEPEPRGGPLKVVYPLAHAYTQAELSFSALKGEDAAVAGLLAAAASEARCDLHLALLTINESGIAEYSDRPARRGSRYEDDGLEAGEVTERSVTLSDWRSRDGTVVPLGEIPVRETMEISPPEACEDLTPDEEHFEEATGNAGASFERTYRRAALVLVPENGLFAVMSQAGLAVTLPFLDHLVQRQATGEDDPARRQALDLAGHIIGQWRAPMWLGGRSDIESAIGTMSRLLARLDDPDLITAFMDTVVTKGRFQKADCASIAAAMARLPMADAAARIEAIILAEAGNRYGHCARLLAAVTERGSLADLACLRRAAEMLVSGLPTKVAEAVFRGPDPVDAALVADLLQALPGIDETLAGRAAAHCLAWPVSYDLDRVLLPAARRLLRVYSDNLPRAVALLRDACVLSLQARTAEVLEPPRDFRRPDTVGCSCDRCRELSRFLASPDQHTWVLRAAAPIRGHVEQTIRIAGCDIDARTERKGSPHSLICTKNQASFERRVVQRRQDLADLEALGGLTSG